MNAIYNTIAFIWNAIAGVIEGGVNFFIKAFNLVASAVNAVADFLHIDEKYRVTEMGEISMPRLNEQAPVNTGPGVGVTPMAAGGVAPIDRRGGAYNVPRAIVGEGSKIYPEYVIPTDPQYRNRALEFWQHGRQPPDGWWRRSARQPDRRGHGSDEEWLLDPAARCPQVEQRSWLQLRPGLGCLPR